MEQLVTWIGGKGKHLDYILPLLPKGCSGWYEPFVGSGSVFFAADGFKHYAVNDLCTELMDLYNAASRGRQCFMSHLKEINKAWRNIGLAYRNQEDTFLSFYYEYEDIGPRYGEYVNKMNELVAHIQYRDVFLQQYACNYAFEMEKRFQFAKMKSWLEKNPVKPNMIGEYLLTAMKKSVYSFFLELYGRGIADDELRLAVFYFLLQFSSNGQFTFDTRGEFRPTYAGKGLNGRTMDSKLAMFRSATFKERMSITKLSCKDAIEFLRLENPGQEDFVYLDPPLGNMFKTVGHHTYSKEEFNNLLELLINAEFKYLMTVPKSFTDAVNGLPGVKATPVGVHGEFTAIMNY